MFRISPDNDSIIFGGDDLSNKVLNHLLLHSREVTDPLRYMCSHMNIETPSDIQRCSFVVCLSVLAKEVFKADEKPVGTWYRTQEPTSIKKVINNIFGVKTPKSSYDHTVPSSWITFMSLIGLHSAGDFLKDFEALIDLLWNLKLEAHRRKEEQQRNINTNNVNQNNDVQEEVSIPVVVKPVVKLKYKYPEIDIPDE